LPKKVDANQPEIVKALRKAGATVQPLHVIGRGCPDILVGWHGRNYLFEIKQAGCKLTGDEKDFHSQWLGQVGIVCKVEDALKLMEL
jgi:hypothetical protein